MSEAFAVSARPRLLEDILTRGVSPINESGLARGFGQHFVDELDRAEVFVVDNVAEWFCTVQAGEIDMRHAVPNIVPPYARTWIEWRDYWENGVDRVGMLLWCHDAGSGENATQEIFSQLRALLAPEQMAEMIGEGWSEIVGERWPGDALRWLIWALPVARAVDTGPVGPIKLWTAALTQTGAIATTPTGHLCNISVFPPGTPPDALKAFSQLMTEGLLALAFMNCHNVSMPEHLPSRQMRRFAKRRGEPMLRFHTVEIDPMKKILQSEGNISHNGLKKALHICRGHFAHYSEDKPLFGKYAGTFWRPAHVRGTAEAGMIGKDYAVKAPS